MMECSMLQAAVRAASVDLYDKITNDADFWKKYIRSETANAVKDIWEDAKPIVQGFLDDIEYVRLLRLQTFQNFSPFCSSHMLPADR